ncbi:NADH-quinone oxidoreductase subunit NuoK [Geoalkalibacter halelectricus]|uniref:NADH-quinone oxidoreductase subunit K n=1 Tax=Geoalkalibacter halelectricus TaxID=2847045 RepID=A0ABY5ZLQ1_9BACT|nr:NADH-quinone oxidoreductase subunit NuoK [Geoalkalibacter halelectricus]MDO3378692.1 NADH-quinone oxidoreductase subunit NuoK [Geoalkalibacter halelectricus]UWZ79998.1 NADH-quinone oxidoreductase subunit NuoK [Geoalkalibacter halelectricus]
MIVPMTHILAISAAMFVMGLACVLAQRNLIRILIGFEIMLNAVGLTLVGASALWQKVDGQIFVIFLMAVTSAEVAIALALVVYLRRRKATLEADAYAGMKG